MRCGACGNSIAAGQEAVFLYGDSFHGDCAFYRPANRRVRDRARS